ncbi:hypothetical protein PR003_g19374 [Phytophthora rubi]|uniref:OTU domain-containing protein n=1 Tax=Phytophthora rubi TaxID=129364 RepID=A0A6A4E5Y4_9STRA|nr:hypothetical protein PR003_g19374 [Phytophthora rubi]
MVDMSGGEPPDPGQGPPVVVDGHLDGAPAPGAPPGHQVAETPLVVPATAWATPADASHRPDGPAPSSMAGAGRVWAGDAAAVLRSSPKLSEEQARASRVVAGVWNPLLQKRLINTMVKDWATLTDRTWVDGERELFNVAMEPAEVMRDGSTRPMTVAEERALLAYMRGELELPHTPNFIKATLSPLHRAMLEDIHEAHFNVTLTTNLPPFVVLKRTANIPHVEIFRSLYTANTDGVIGRDMMRCLQLDVKRFIYDGVHTLRFVFYSGRVAAHWARQSLRFQKAVITLHNTSRSSGAVASGAYTAAHMEQMYALHVYGGGSLGLAALSKALAHVSGAEVLDVEFPRTTKPRFTTIATTFPRHGTARCKATPGALHALQAKGTRIVNGVVPTFSPQARDSYKVKDVAELMALLAAHEAALVPHAEVVLDRVNGTSAVASEATPLRNVVAGTAASPAVVNTTGASTEVAEAAGDGYVVKLSERAKRAARKNNSTAAPVQQARQRSIPDHTTASTIAVAQEATDVRTPSVAPKARKKGRKQSGFAAFQRAEALGHYGVLAEDDSDGDDNTDVVTTSGAADVEMIDHDSTASIARPDVDEAVDVEMGDAPASAPPSEQTQPVLPAPLVSEPPAAPTVPVASCSKATTALVQTTLARYVNGTGLPTETNHPTQNERSDDDIVPATPTSQEEFTMGTSHTGSAEGDSDLPIQAAHWLASFAGREIAVAANGQCAFLALYATVSNHSSATLANTAATMTQATEVKRGIYSLMMVNLRHDVELGVVDPIAEYRRLYPTQPLHDSVVAATAALFARYAQERRRSTKIQVPQSFWAGPHELRAMAQYLRQPLVVLTVDKHGDAHIQRYMYKELRLRNGGDHETGYYEALTDRQAREYLFECWSLHVLPYFLILRQHERHFHGVSHGDIFVKWRAEGDNQYAALVSDSFSWKSTINLLSPSDEVELASLNQLANVDTVNAVFAQTYATQTTA